ncbi:MAG: hypothetical protein KF792_17200 [Chelatococcus sp.]|nr:hypothetical protein [Chelatococcus sp.]
MNCAKSVNRLQSMPPLVALRGTEVGWGLLVDHDLVAITLSWRLHFISPV